MNAQPSTLQTAEDSIPLSSLNQGQRLDRIESAIHRIEEKLFPQTPSISVIPPRRDKFIAIATKDGQQVGAVKFTGFFHGRQFDIVTRAEATRFHERDVLVGILRGIQKEFPNLNVDMLTEEETTFATDRDEKARRVADELTSSPKHFIITLSEDGVNYRPIIPKVSPQNIDFEYCEVAEATTFNDPLDASRIAEVFRIPRFNYLGIAIRQLSLEEAAVSNPKKIVIPGLTGKSTFIAQKEKELNEQLARDAALREDGMYAETVH